MALLTRICREIQLLWFDAPASGASACGLVTGLRLVCQGTLVTALKAGDWVLLDEINLASAETLECLSGLLESTAGSVVLMERG